MFGDKSYHFLSPRLRRRQFSLSLAEGEMRCNSPKAEAALGIWFSRAMQENFFVWHENFFLRNSRRRSIVHVEKARGSSDQARLLFGKWLR